MRNLLVCRLKTQKSAAVGQHTHILIFIFRADVDSIYELCTGTSTQNEFIDLAGCVGNK